MSPLFKVYKKVIKFSFTPTKNILVFSFSFQFIQRIEEYILGLTINLFEAETQKGILEIYVISTGGAGLDLKGPQKILYSFFFQTNQILQDHLS